MNFDTSEEQELLQDTIGKWAARECPPTRVRQIFDGDAVHDPALWRGPVRARRRRAWSCPRRTAAPASS